MSFVFIANMYMLSTVLVGFPLALVSWRAWKDMVFEPWYSWLLYPISTRGGSLAWLTQVLGWLHISFYDAEKKKLYILLISFFWPARIIALIFTYFVLIILACLWVVVRIGMVHYDE